MNYMRERHYKYAYGRFITPDRINGKVKEILSWNLYSYVQDNPLKYTDPEGEMLVAAIIVTKAINANITTILEQAKKLEIYLKIQLQMALNAGKLDDALATATGLALLKLMPKNEKEFLEMGMPSISAMAAETKGVKIALGTARENILESIKGTKVEKLFNMINDLFKKGSRIGTGSTADAIRYELKSGKAVGGKFHFQKSLEYREALRKIMHDPNLTANEKKIVKEIIIDLQNALSGR